MRSIERDLLNKDSKIIIDTDDHGGHLDIMIYYLKVK